MIHSQTRKVTAGLCGTEAVLSVPGTLFLIEDSLTELTGLLEIDGLTAMHRYHAVMVYVKNHIRFFGRAVWNEELTVESFVSDKKRISFCIDTCIRNAKQELIAYSRIELCGIDMESKRLRKIETVGVDDHVVPETPPVEISFFPRRTYAPSYIDSVTVKACNIDYVHHTNNIEYIKFLLNTCSVDELEKNIVDEMEISYLNQSHEGDTLDISAEKSDHMWFFTIQKQDTAVLRCEIKLHQSPQKI